MTAYQFPPSEKSRLKRHAPRELLHPLDWMAQSIDYSREPRYDTPFKGKFDPNLFPFWRDPLEWAQSPNIREIVVKKCSRAGGSETFLLGDMRYTVANKPERCAYYGSDQDSTEAFMKNRVKLGMGLSVETKALFKRAKSTENFIAFPAMDFLTKYPRQKSAFKQEGYARIYADEVSTWPAFAADMLRKRADMYPFHNISFISSPDPARKGTPDSDPIIILYEETDKQQWFMPDPEAEGKLFHWHFSGVKWPKDAKNGDEWDLDMVRKEAYYETPNGTKITNDQRMDLVRAGKWMPTAKPGRDDVRGINITAPMIPTGSGDFGELAARFLSAKYRLTDTGTREQIQNNPLRVYFAEYWAEAHREEQVQVHDDTLAHCAGDYAWKEINVQPDSVHGIFCTSDVQKYHLWWLARVWEMKKSGAIASHLLDYGNCATFEDLDATLGEFDPRMVGIDIGYAKRAAEVMDYCANYTDQSKPRNSVVLALRGSDNLKKSIMDEVVRDAFEGRRSGENLFLEITWATDVFRQWLIERMDATDYKWTVPAGLGEDKKGVQYLRQVTTTKKIDGIWTPPKHGQDHLFDCEVMQLVLARHEQLIN